MAFDYTIKITDYSGGTVTLTSAPFDVRDYHIKTAPVKQKTVAETMEVRLMDGSAPDNLSEVRNLQSLLRQATEHWENRAKKRVYVEFTDSAGGTALRSPIRSARAEWLDTVLKRPYWDAATQFYATHLERMNYWEGAEAQLPLTNPNGTATLSALNVYGINDGQGTFPLMFYNYADIAQGAVAGDLPAPCRLEMTFAVDFGRLSHIWIGHNYTDPGTFTHWLEAEDGAGSGNEAQATASGGSVRSKDLTSGVETDITTWTVSAAQATAAAGRPFKGIVRFFSTVNLDVTRFRLKIQLSSNNMVNSGLIYADMNADLSNRDFFNFDLPPWLQGLDDLSALDMALSAIQSSGTTKTIKVDAMQVTPVDGFRHLVAFGFGAAVNERFVDDGIDDYRYIDDGSGGAKRGNVIGYGKPIMLEPGALQRLYFMLESNANTIGLRIGLKVYCRPRRLSP